jgi:hypothetical protein
MQCNREHQTGGSVRLLKNPGQSPREGRIFPEITARQIVELVLAVVQLARPTVRPVSRPLSSLSVLSARSLHPFSTRAPWTRLLPMADLRQRQLPV